MSKFSVGDRVRVMQPESHALGIGTEYKVEDVAYGEVRINATWWPAEYFKLITPDKAARAVGDFSHEPTQRLISESGAQKGMRVTRHDLIPPAALREVAAVYGYGELKYPAGEDGPNWLRGMPFSWNERAALDHISAWREGVDFDTEDGVSHLAHAVWHLLAILEFQARGIGEDDRPFK